MQTILTDLKRYYPNLVQDEENSTSEQVTFRLNLTNEEDAELFRQKYGGISKTEWIRYHHSSNPQRNLFSKTWICQHSKCNKKKGSTRNADCRATLSIVIKKITKSTKRTDKYLKAAIPLPGVIKISLVHSHQTSTAESLKMLRVHDEISTAFYEYFSKGMTPIEAIRLHENKFIMEENFKELANASVNPTQNQVYYLYKCWKNDNLGSPINPFEKLKENIPFYESNGTVIKLDDEDPWAVLLVSPIMQRNHALASSGEMIFIDSTSSCDTSSQTVTVILSATSVGALPIAVVIHSSQTLSSYAKAFQLLKTHFPKCFGGKDHPETFMTDDSSAEKGALSYVWPGTHQLLCHFHVAQAEWRWIFSNQNIPKDDKPTLMKLFQAVMYADSEDTFETSKENLMSVSYTDFKKRFLAFEKRKEEWVLFFRSNLITRKNNTNNFAEATIRILKDVILCRTRAFNVVALCEFFIGMWEEYFTKKLLEFAHSRRSAVRLFYDDVKKRGASITEDDIEELEENIFQIQSGVNTYSIKADLGVCTCPAGRTGAFCKHQSALMEHKKIKLPNAPPITPEDRYKIAVLALGPKCPQLNFFLDFKSCPSSEPETSGMSASLSTDMDDTTDMEITPPSPDQEEKIDFQRGILRKEMERVLELSQLADLQTSRKLIANLKKIQSPEDFKNLFVLKKPLISKKIKVQPTSIARRKSLLRSGRRLPSGRPLAGIKKIIKRARNLKENIDANRCNAKSHGKGH